MSGIPLNYFGSQRDYAHVLLFSQFPCYRSKNTCSLGVAVVVDDDCCIIVEADVGTVSAADFLLRSDDYGLDNVALLYVAVGRGFANRSDYNVADCTDFAEAAALYLNAENLARAGIISAL